MRKHKIVVLLLFLSWSMLTNISFGFAVRPGYVIATVFLILASTGISTVLARILVIVMSLLSLILFPVTANFGTHVLNMLIAIRYTNIHEALETVRNLPLLQCLMGGLTLVLGIVLCRCLSAVMLTQTFKQTSFLLVVFMGIIFYRPTVKWLCEHESFVQNITYPPIKLLVNAKDALKQIEQDEALVRSANSLPTTFSPKTVGNHYNTYILVIGESVRRDYMSEYGFPVQNTPFLSSVNGVFFDNWVSAGPSTVPSLTNSLLKNHEYNNSVIHLAQKAGFFTFWISNQGSIGVSDSPVSVIGKQADFSYFLKKGDYGSLQTGSELIPEVTKALSRQGRKLVVVHLMGSHPDFCVRTRNHYDKWYVNKKLSCYVQSIKNTDKLLNTIYLLVQQSGDKWSMLYFADHGLAHNSEQSLVHHDQYLQDYMPPFIITGYDYDKKVHISALRSGFDFMKIFAQWLEIDEPSLHSSINWFSEQFSGEPYVIDGNGRKVLFSTRDNDPVIPIKN